MTLLGRAYELYKIDWKSKHLTHQMELDEMNNYFDYLDECDDLCAYDEYLEEYGYGYEMYVSIEEFEENEFEDEEYMKQLLREKDFEEWKRVME